MVRSSLQAALVLLLSISTVFATWQIPDVLIYEGKEYSLFDELLEPYFKKYPERNPKDEDKRCSANWRGYKAVFEVSNGEIVLKDVYEDACSRSTVSQMTKAVPDGKPLKIDWYSGVLASMNGKNRGDSYSVGFLYSFEKYSLFEIDKGRLTAAKHFDKKGFHDFRTVQFEKFKKTEEFQESLKKMTADGKLSIEDAEESIRIWFPFSLKKFL
jgi:hypothetical protein